jgi:glucosylceramidase
MVYVRIVAQMFVSTALVVSLTSEFSRADDTTTVYLTAKGTDFHLTKVEELAWTDMAQPSEKVTVVFVDPAKSFQTILGIGGALTDATAETFFKLPAARQQEVLQAYFDPTLGIGYTLGRTHINSCDFSSDVYTYVADGDKELATFNVEHDRKYRIPFIRLVLATAGKNFTLFASPWSPPAWMKDNNDMLHGGSLKPEFNSAWANYYANFIEAYAKEGIPIWGITVQNEPMASQSWESCIYTAQQERDFVKGFLGPTLAARGLADKKIIVWDHNRTMMYQRAETILNDPAAAKYVWGVGYHWYVNDSFANVRLVHEAFPAAHLMFTEGCTGPYDVARIGEWQWGEAYGKSMINDFNCGAEAWTDWNVLLDDTGGPNHVSNFCYAPVIGDPKTGELHYMNSFYYIGHFSKFIRPGAQRIISSSTADNLLTTAFLNPDGTVVVVIMNDSDLEYPLMLSMRERAASTKSPAHSIMSVVIPNAPIAAQP